MHLVLIVSNRRVQIAVFITKQSGNVHSVRDTIDRITHSSRVSFNALNFSPEIRPYGFRYASLHQLHAHEQSVAHFSLHFLCSNGKQLEYAAYSQPHNLYVAVLTRPIFYAKTMTCPSKAEPVQTTQECT